MDRKRWTDEEPVNAAMFAREAAFAERRFEYLVQRRDALLDRIRFGALAINAASLVALTGILGGTGEAAAWIGFNPSRAQESSACFLAGLLLSTAAIWLEGKRSRSEPADANARRVAAQQLIALYEADALPENHVRIGQAMSDYHRLPLVDFQFSLFSIWVEALAGGAWVGGIVVPLAHLLLR